MRSLIQHFGKNRRSAVAVIFALALVPLVGMVSLSVDYSFYIQSRSQAALAADAAATHAVRAADASYTYYQAQNDPSAAAHAEAAGSGMGVQWFSATLGKMPRAAITGTPIVNVTQNANGSAGFTASVSFSGTYPPFFASMFNSAAWHIDGSSQATSSFKYVEIMMMLDNSPSMLIGANEADIKALGAITACPPSTIDGSSADNTYNGSYYQHVSDGTGTGNYFDIPQTANSVPNYTPGTYGSVSNSTDGKGYAAGKCATGYTGGNSSPQAPCAFACHTTTNQLPSNTKFSNDYYGLARAYSAANPNAPITLRLDVLQAAAASVVTAMQVNEATAGQFSVGVYQFNSDIVPIFPAAGANQTEASTDLTDAATAIQNAPVPLQSNAGVGYTNFPTSMADLIGGKYLNGNQFGYTNTNGQTVNGVQAAGDGTTAATPLKDIFIVTDGMEDTSYPNGRNEGEMTGWNAEHAATSQTADPWVCQPLKNLGFTVYVLYIKYEPLTNSFYQNSGVTSSKYTTSDYPGLAGASTKKYAESTAASQGAPPDASVASLPPIEAGLSACATSPSDFFEADSSADIGTAMNTMLQSALTSTVELTQ